MSVLSPKNHPTRPVCGESSSRSLEANGFNVGMLSVNRPDVLTQNEIQAPLAEILRVLKKHPEVDIFLAPEWIFGAPPHYKTEAEFRTIQAALAAATQGTSKLVVPGTIVWVDNGGRTHNTALVVCNGRTLLEYSKRSDGDDAAPAKQVGLHWQPGRTSGVFEWRGYKVGLEICADNRRARLRRDLAKTDLKSVDLQLLVSAGVVPKNDRLAVHQGGLIACAEGTCYGPQVWRVQKAPQHGKAPRYDFEFFDQGSSNARREKLNSALTYNQFAVPAPVHGAGADEADLALGRAKPSGSNSDS
jgi:hypothetical protein